MVLDTNILIAYLRGDNAAVDALSSWKRQGKGLLVSSITVAEVLALPALTSNEVRVIARFLRTFLTVSFDSRLAEAAAGLCRSYRMKVPDAAIAVVSRWSAATALFQKVTELELVVI